MSRDIVCGSTFKRQASSEGASGGVALGWVMRERRGRRGDFALRICGRAPPDQLIERSAEVPSPPFAIHPVCIRAVFGKHILCFRDMYHRRDWQAAKFAEKRTHVYSSPSAAPLTGGVCYDSTGLKRKKRAIKVV